MKYRIVAEIVRELPLANLSSNSIKREERRERAANGLVKCNDARNISKKL